ncbi:MAG: DUF3877 family protein [Mobilitalea sp.]
MSLLKQPDFMGLENNIMDVIKEEQIKLGYRDEKIRLYYPMESLKNYLGNELNKEELDKYLAEFREYVIGRLGNLEISNIGDRYCILIPASGVTYVHHNIRREFLEEFIKTISNHNLTIENILKVFYSHSEKVVCKKENHGEFEYLIYFEDGIPDSYRYCITFEGPHAIYHRFTITDYNSFDFS